MCLLLLLVYFCFPFRWMKIECVSLPVLTLMEMSKKNFARFFFLFFSFVTLSHIFTGGYIWQLSTKQKGSLVPGQTINNHVFIIYYLFLKPLLVVDQLYPQVATFCSLRRSSCISPSAGLRGVYIFSESFFSCD